LPAPTEREKSQMCIQRYLPHLPAGGEVVIFDRSWYNRAGVERVMGFCTEKQVERFLSATPKVEQAIPYEKSSPEKIELPKRRIDCHLGGDYAPMLIPEMF
jgi:polyphosphate kinase 2 (PPK2 family)